MSYKVAALYQFAALPDFRKLREPLRAFCGTWMLCFWAGEIVQMSSGDILTYWRVVPLYLYVLALAVQA